MNFFLKIDFKLFYLSSDAFGNVQIYLGAGGRAFRFGGTVLFVFDRLRRTGLDRCRSFEPLFTGPCRSRLLFPYG
jgi:hypothetical protein